MTMPGNSPPFLWANTVSTDNATVMVSLFPVTDADIGLADPAKKIEIVGRASTWAQQTDFNSPAQPKEPIEAS